MIGVSEIRTIGGKGGEFSLGLLLVLLALLVLGTSSLGGLVA